MGDSRQTYTPSTIALFNKLDIPLRPLVPQTKLPTESGLGSSSESQAEEARSLLVQQRIKQPGYRSPAEKKRNHVLWWRLAKRSDETRWKFKRVEVAQSFHDLLCTTPLRHAVVAQALLGHASGTSVQDLWKLRLGRKKADSSSDMTWLDIVTAQNRLDYIRLLCHNGLDAELLNRALSIALDKRYLDAVRILLSYGALATSCAGISSCLKADDVELARVLLSVPHAMTIADWRLCLSPPTSAFPTVLALCLRQHPSIATEELLLSALSSQNIEAAALILLDPGGAFVSAETCRVTCNISDHRMRYNALALLHEVKGILDTAVFQEEMMRSAGTNSYDIVRILVSAGVSSDSTTHNVLKWAMLGLRLDVLEILATSKFKMDIVILLESLPALTSEEDMLRMLRIFHRHIVNAHLFKAKLLVRASEACQVMLVRELLNQNASTEYNELRAIQIAIQRSDLELLELLLGAPCSPEALSKTLPTALALTSRVARLQFMDALIKKGVVPSQLGAILCVLMEETQDVDEPLASLLVSAGAPVDKIQGAKESCIVTVVRKGNPALLSMLLKAHPSAETLAEALPSAFGTLHNHGYHVACDLIQLLLDHGASGESIDRTLLLAARHDSRLGIVRLLAGAGANANFSNGDAFIVAIKSRHKELLEVLCRAAPLNHHSAKAVLDTVTSERHFNLQALNILLESCPDSASLLNTYWSTKRIQTNLNFEAIVRCALRYGLGVDIDKGLLIRCAIARKNNKFLLTLLRAKPSPLSLKAGFHEAAMLSSSDFRIETMSLLLGQTGSEIGQSQWLRAMTQSALEGDSKGLELILKHRASVDHDEGSAVAAAAKAGSGEVLDMLLNCRPSRLTVYKACLALMSSNLVPGVTERLLRSLLDAEAKLLPEQMSKLLTEVLLRKFPENQSLLEELLARGAVPDLEALKVAIQKCDHVFCLRLLSKASDPDIARKVFRHVRQVYLPQSERCSIYRLLLSHGIPQDDVSGALLDSFDVAKLISLDLPKLLLQHGAQVGFDNGRGFRLALNACKSVDAFMLMCQYIDNDKSAGIAFDLVRSRSITNETVRARIYRSLLQWNITEPKLYDALLQGLRSERPDIPMIQLLLRKGVNPNKNKAEAFVLACKSSHDSGFRALSRYAKLGVVLQALVNHFDSEGEVLQWFNICLDERPKDGKIDAHHCRDILMQCLKKYRKGTALIKILLDNGLSASTMIDHSVCGGWEPERCTALIWALTYAPKIENDAILTIIRRAGKDVSPLYCTPVTGVSAAFLCVLDKSRAPVLKALLKLDKASILASVIPGSSLSYLGAYPNIFDLSDEDLSAATGGMRLSTAALYLGNFDAFRLVYDKQNPEDGILHLAAFLALPQFVKWLLQTHDPDCQEEDFDNYTPLAVSCDAQPLPWSKFADEEANFAKRRKDTMKLLVRKNSFLWRHRERTVLHIALERGVEATSAMMEALNIRSDSEKHKRYCYVDREGKSHTPQEYVDTFLDRTDDEKAALKECLTKGGFTSPTDLPGAWV